MISWSSLPYEVQLSIVVEVVNTPDVLAPASALLDILLVSPDIHDSVLGASARGIEAHNDLYLRLFNSRFDSAGPIRRLAKLAPGGLFTPDIFAVVFKYRCSLLRDIQSGAWFRRIETGHLDRKQFERALWEVLLMLWEDEGQNLMQLEHAGVENWLRDIILFFVEEDMGADGWPTETLILQLAAASFAIVSDRASVIREGKAVNRTLINALEPFFFASHRYAHTHLPITCVYPRHVREVPFVPADSLRTMDTMPIAEPFELVYFCYRLTFSPPPITNSVALIITNRQEGEDIRYLTTIPIDRAEADARNFNGATQRDWIEINHFRKLVIGVETPRAGGGSENPAGLENPLVGSRRWDHLFHRVRAVGHLLTHISDPMVDTWFNTLYTPGMLTGNWLGRIVFPDIRFYQRMLESHPAVLSVIRDSLMDHELGVYANYFQANLREYIKADEYGLGCGEAGLGNGVQNGYFSSNIDPSIGRNMYESGSEVVVNDPSEEDSRWATKRFQLQQGDTVLPKYPSLPRLELADPNVRVPVEAEEVEVSEDVEMDFEREGVEMSVPHIDVIITGETDYAHGKAWGAYTFYGRVRKLDGLVVLVRVPQNPDPNSGQGRWIFSGNIHMADTIVGRWRDTSSDVWDVGFQAPFIISKIGPGFIPPA
ncbi:hypothetical protein K439DRAFT_1658539 [Ramaria rubella]|nr:hypothetical protein K439DRAFT_1658539 [Ramaria rubella]